MNSVQDTLIKKMLEPAFYDHPVKKVELVETHISWVFLAGDFVYKVKKPVDFGFLDFSTLAQRRHFCAEELRLNRRFAPQLYLALVRIGGDTGSLRLGGEPVLDYAVKMKRFATEQQLDRLQAGGRLHAAQIEAFATHLALLHRQAPIADSAQPFGSAESIRAPIVQNFRQLHPLLPLLPPGRQHQLDKLEDWSLAACAQLKPLLEHRKAQGFIRECHGDVHLGNMAWHEGKPLLFDCIEFNENLRWIDPLNDIAFLVMDLDDRGEESFGWRFLNRYLQESGDYPGLALLDFYKVYRALVRAKVACLRLAQPELEAAEQATEQRLACSYLDLAAGYIAKRQPRLIISHGLSGAGKTTLIDELSPCCGALGIDSDTERKRLHALATTADSRSKVGGGIYTDAATAETYRRLQELAEILLRAGISVIVDATFIKRQPRAAMQRLARRLRVPFVILDFPRSAKELEQRIAERALQPGQTSEATCEVLDYQLANQEPLTATELKNTIRIDPEMSAATVAARLASRD